MLSVIFDLYKERWTAGIRIMLAIILSATLVSLGIETAKYIEKENQDIADKAKITIVYSSIADNDYLNKNLTTLRQHPDIKNAKYISSESALQTFLEKYGEVSKELLTVNPFPAIIILTLKKDNFNSSKYLKLVEIIKNDEMVDEVQYKKEFIESYSILINMLSQFANVIVIMISILLAFLIYLSIRTEFMDFSKKLKKRFLLEEDTQEGVSIFYCIMSNFIFVLFNIIFGLVITVILFLIAWWLWREDIAWLQLMHLDSVIIGISTIGLYSFLMSILSAIFVKRNFSS